jgi:hypothetical protein
MWSWYKQLIAIVCDDFLAKQRKYELKANFDSRMDQMDMKNHSPFQPVQIDAEPE